MHLEGNLVKSGKMCSGISFFQFWIIEILTGSYNSVATDFFQESSISWLNLGLKNNDKLARILQNLVLNPNRILNFRGYTFLSGFSRFLAQSWFKSNGKLIRILQNLSLKRDRILNFRGYTLLSGFSRFLRKKEWILAGSWSYLSRISRWNIKDCP